MALREPPPALGTVSKSEFEEDLDWANLFLGISEEVPRKGLSIHIYSSKNLVMRVMTGEWEGQSALAD